MNWLLLLVAVCFEIGWPLGFKMSTVQPERSLLWMLLGMLSYVFSGFFLYLAQRTIPISTAYVVWTGAGAVTTFLMGVFLFGDAASISRIFFAFLIIVGIVGLELTTRS
ncbi:MAG: multidrug efflux SMR transporter [Paludibacteraceae bacterium]|nr:multidrug efflux SMR transporter [Paludibacteraceae bacterium]